MEFNKTSAYSMHSRIKAQSRASTAIFSSADQGTVKVQVLDLKGEAAIIMVVF